MGGEGGSPRLAAETAASTAAGVFEHQLAQLDAVTEDSVKRAMEYAFASAREKLQETEGAGNTVGSMVKFLEIDGKKMAAIAHAGDTRVFRRKLDGSYDALTTDQSRGNTVFNGFKGDQAMKDEYIVVPVEAGERFMLNSDGITGDWESQFLTPEQFEQAFGAATPKDAAEAFMMASKKNDDKSVLIVDVQ